MSAPSYRSRWPTIAKQWDAMSLTRPAQAQDAAERILANKARYQGVEAKTGVPWWWIGAVHYREADFDFDTQLAQGDPLGKVSVNVPRGQGPYHGPDAWERAALIALEDHGLTKIIDWRIEKALYWAESYNGWGYFNHGVPSAYVWAGTNIYKGGQYIRDGVWSETAQDRRSSVAAILRALADMGAVMFVRETPDLVPAMPPAPTIPEKPPMTNPVPTPDISAVLLELAQAIKAVNDKVDKQKQTPEFQAVYKAVVAWLPNLGVYGVVAAAVLNAWGAVGSTPMAGSGNATLVSILAPSLGALLSAVLPKGK